MKKKNHARMSILSTVLLGALSLGIVVAPSANAAPAPTSVSSVVSASTYNDPFAKKVHDLMNAERAKVGSRPLVWNQRIANVSQDWANQIGAKTQNGTFDWNQVHRADGGGSLIPSGATMYREIIGFNFTPDQIVQWWMDSPSHKAAMLHPSATDAGVGYVVPTSGPYKGWYMVVSNLAGYPGTAIPSPAGAISYAGHVQNVGWQSTVSNGAIAGSTGLGLRLESLKFNTSGQTARAHVQNIGWQDYRSGASTIGTSGQGLRMEAVQVQSTIAGKSIRCQAHVENIGWMAEVGDGEVCGTVGKSLRLEAVRIRIV